MKQILFLYSAATLITFSSFSLKAQDNPPTDSALTPPTTSNPVPEPPKGALVEPTAEQKHTMKKSKKAAHKGHHGKKHKAQHKKHKKNH